VHNKILLDINVCWKQFIFNLDLNTVNEQLCVLKVKKWLKVVLMEAHFRAMEHHLPYGIPQCYLPPDTGERVPP